MHVVSARRTAEIDGTGPRPTTIPKDERTVLFRQRALACMIAQSVWLPQYTELPVDATYTALQAKGWYDGVGGDFDRSKVEAAMETAHSYYLRMVDLCKAEMLQIFDEHLESRRQVMHKATHDDKKIVNELSAADVRGGRSRSSASNSRTSWFAD